MKNTILKKLTQPDMSASKFFSVLALDLENSIDVPGLIDIEMLRVGTFKHKKYGDLEITDEMLDKMVDNFYDGIIGREVSFDWNHKAEKASAWLKDVKANEGVLIGSIELTKEGKKSIEEKEYGYFSIEYSDDFIDPETEEQFGPTIIGGALTNRPFMTKLRKIEFSLEDSDVSLYRLEEDKKMPNDKIVREPVKKTEDLTLEEVVAQNKELENKIKELEAQKPAPETNHKLEEFIEAQKIQLEATNRRLEAIESENKTLKETSVSFATKAKVSEVERMCDNLIMSEKHHPAVITIAKEIMLNDTSEKIIKFTETIGEGDDAKTHEVNCNITDAVLRLLEAIPKTQRADYTERTTSASDKTLSEEDQEKTEDAGIAASFKKKGLKRLSVVK